MHTNICRVIKENIKRDDPVPVYYQIACEFERLIKNKTLLPGEKLPGDLCLSNTLAVDYRTLKKALFHLHEKGLLEVRKNVGAFVSTDVSVETPTIGFFYLAEAEYFMARRGEFMHRKFTDAAFDMKIFPHSRQEFFEQVNLYEEIRKKGLAGAVIVPVMTQACKDSLLELERKNFPYVRLGRSFFTGELRAPLVRGNDSKRTEDALKYLWSLGHREIGLITFRRGDEREAVYNEFFADRRCVKRWVDYTESSETAEQWDKTAGMQFAGKYILKNPDVTAILCDGHVAVDFTRVLPACGKQAPADLSLLSFSDRAELTAVTPEITSMGLSNRAMGDTAAELLLKVMESGYGKEEKIFKIEYELVERESVAPPAITRAGAAVP